MDEIHCKDVKELLSENRELIEEKGANLKNTKLWQT
jgi:hypothetical protein